MRRIEGLQILRFAAAGMVLVGHTFMELSQHGMLDASTYRQLDQYPWGAGVDIFFVISGFVIASIASQTPKGWAGAVDFFAKRIIRVVPVYWFYTAVMAMTALLFSSYLKHTTISWEIFLKSLFFVPQFIEGEPAPRPLLQQGWTLQYEFYFYSMVALALSLPRHTRFAATMASIFALFVISYALPISGAIGTFLQNPIVFEFGLGILIFRYQGAFFRIGTFSKFLMSVSGFFLLWLVSGAGGEPLRFLTAGIPAAMVVSSALATMRDGTASMLRPAIVLGDASYSLYLSHPFVVNFVFIVLRRVQVEGPEIAFVAAVGSSLVVALGSYAILEKLLSRNIRVAWDGWIAQSLKPLSPTGSLK